MVSSLAAFFRGKLGKLHVFKPRILGKPRVLMPLHYSLTFVQEYIEVGRMTRSLMPGTSGSG